MLALQLLVIAGLKPTVHWPILKLVSFLKIHALLESATHAPILHLLDITAANLVATEVKPYRCGKILPCPQPNPNF